MGGIENNWRVPFGWRQNLKQMAAILLQAALLPRDQYEAVYGKSLYRQFIRRLPTVHYLGYKMIWHGLAPYESPI